MFDYSTLEWLRLLYVSLTGGCVIAIGIVAWFFITTEKVHKKEGLRIK